LHLGPSLTSLLELLNNDVIIWRIDGEMAHGASGAQAQCSAEQTPFTYPESKLAHIRHMIYVWPNENHGFDVLTFEHISKSDVHVSS